MKKVVNLIGKEIKVSYFVQVDVPDFTPEESIESVAGDIATSIVHANAFREDSDAYEVEREESRECWVCEVMEPEEEEDDN